MEWAARVGQGFQRRLTDIRAAQRYERETAAEEAVREEQARLASEVLPMKDFPTVASFVPLFGGEEPPKLFRRPILAIIGGTNLGKSMLAAHVLKMVGERLGPGWACLCESAWPVCVTRRSRPRPSANPAAAARQVACGKKHASHQPEFFF